MLSGIRLKRGGIMIGKEKWMVQHGHGLEPATNIDSLGHVCCVQLFPHFYRLVSYMHAKKTT